jgi:UDP-glucose 4-epimerase
MRILITGSSGYVGSSFLNQYKNKYLSEKFSLLKYKIEEVNLKNIDTVLHCAALVHQKVEHPYAKYQEVNVEYPVKLAKLAKQNGVKQFVFMSTIAVYGKEQQILDENTICNPTTPYGKSKLEAEKELLKLNDENFIVSIIRSPMIYGQNAPGNIDNLVKLIKKVPVIPLGSIDNRRSFISIQNLCHMIDVIITQQQKGIFLACDDEPLSTSRLCELIAKNLNKKIYLVKVPLFESLLKIFKTPFHKRLYGSLEIDNSITKEKLNLSNPYSIEEGIELMVKDELK